MVVSARHDVKYLGQLRLPSWIFLLVFIGFGFCSDSSSFSSKVETSDQNFDPNDSEASSVYTSKFIMKSYYEKYESLDDSDFKTFVAQELPFGLCDTLPDNPNLVPRLLGLERKLVGEGSHRRISSMVKVSFGVKPRPKLSQCSCEVIIIERLHLGVFADPFELQHLLRRGVFGDIAVFGDTNLESPSFLSNRSAVEIHMNVGPDILRRENEVDIQLDLPLHARYAPLNETGYSQVRFDAPDLFLRCSVEGKFRSRSCLYMIENEGNELQRSEIVWKIPSGINSHSRIVYIFTFLSASLAALVIVLASICHSSVSRCNSLKRS